MIYVEKKLFTDDPILLDSLKEEFKIVENTDSVNYSNSDILLKTRKNSFLVPYEYGRGITGKDEYVLRWGNGCSFNCIYCYVRQNPSFDKRLTLFAQINKIRKEIEDLLKYKESILINAGENFDSFILEERTGFTTRLTNLFSEYPQITVEYRTKALIPEQYINNIVSKNTFIAVSLNPEKINLCFEKGTSDYKKRINNINLLLKKGHRVALRIEPIILTDDFPENYFDFIERINNDLDINKLESIDIALLRLTKKGLSSLKNVHDIFKEEWILSKSDKKYRYFVRQRILSLKSLRKKISEYYKGPIYIGGEPKHLIKYMI